MQPWAMPSLTLVTVVSLAVSVLASHLYREGPVQGLTTEPQAPAFDVASVKPNRSGNSVPATIGVQSGGRFLATNVPARTLISYAYRLQEYQVIGGPAWLDSDRFDIVGKSPESQPLAFPSPAGPPTTLPLMVRALLADRFSLLAHPDTRELPIYQLVVARTDRQLGPQIRSSTADCSGQPAPPPPGQRPTCGFRLTPGSFSAGGRTLAQLAGTLSQFVRRPVDDATGLTGAFEFDLTWTPDTLLNSPPESAPAVDPDRPTLFTALQEQLGLRLQAARRPVPVLVVDGAEKPAPD